ncbi:MAG: substrate-binding domain-containing protein [Clostridia bacterium]|nr:substrate-binding domain-containing protein [Clostridia bacterium]
MKKSFKLIALVCIFALLFTCLTLVACNKQETQKDEAQKVVRISTTTSVNDSGLMEYLRPYFEADTGYKWEISSAGTGAAIAAATYGNADVILVHSKKSEDEFVAGGFSYIVSGYKAERVSFMHNFFVLVGPASDPAGVKDVKAQPGTNVKDAFAAIASTESIFISRGDKSGTHNKEVTLWPAELGIANAAGKPAEPVPELAWYKSLGQGMGACLTAAKEQNGYVLTDKATFLSFKNNPNGDQLPNLEILWEEDASMKNTYSILCVKKDAPFVSSITGEALPAGAVDIDTTAAEVFLNWMTGEHASALIAYYGVTKYGGSLFTLDTGYRA